jgi:hypothetical protein
MVYSEFVAQMEQGDWFIMILGVIGVFFAVIAYRLQSGFTLRLWHIMIIALMLRMPLMVESLWYDETFSGVASELLISNPSQYETLLMSDVHPEFAYRIFPFRSEHNQLLADAELRLIPLLAGIGVVYLVYWLSLEIFKKSYSKHQIAITASLLVAFLPAQIQYSAEARAYMPMVALVLVGTLGVIRNKPHWAIMPLAGLPLLNNHGYLWLGILMLLAFFMNVWKKPRDANWIQWAVTFVCVGGMATLSFINTTYPQMEDVSNGFWLRDVTPGTVVGSLATVTVGARMPSGIMVLVAVMVIAISIVSLWAVGRNRILWAMIFGMPLVTAFISVVWSPIYLPRAILPAGVFMVIAWAYFAQESRVAHTFVFGMVAIPLVFGYSPDYQKMDIRTFLTDGCLGTDLIYAPATNLGIMSLWYSNGLPVVVAPSPNDLNQWLNDEALNAIALPRVDWDDVRGHICVPFSVNPMMGSAQRDFKRKLDLMFSHGLATRWLMDSTSYQDFYIYKVWHYEQ